MGAHGLAGLAGIAAAAVAADLALSTHSEAVVVAEDLGVMLDTRRRCGLRRRTFLPQERLRGVFVSEVRAVCIWISVKQWISLCLSAGRCLQPTRLRRLRCGHTPDCVVAAWNQTG